MAKGRIKKSKIWGQLELILSRILKLNKKLFLTNKTKMWKYSQVVSLAKSSFTKTQISYPPHP